MKKFYLNYLLIVVGIILIAMNIYENNFQIDKGNIWRIIGALCFITLGTMNIYNQMKRENRFQNKL